MNSLPLLPRKQVNERVNLVLDSLGLQTCADQRIGTPIQRGISGGKYGCLLFTVIILTDRTLSILGQKRRVTAACAMVTYPYVVSDSPLPSTAPTLNHVSDESSSLMK